jgi:hypothetical protein
VIPRHNFFLFFFIYSSRAAAATPPSKAALFTHRSGGAPAVVAKTIGGRDGVAAASPFGDELGEATLVLWLRLWPDTSVELEPEDEPPLLPPGAADDVEEVSTGREQLAPPGVADALSCTKLAHPIRVLLAKWKTTLRLPKNEPRPGTREA